MKNSVINIDVSRSGNHTINKIDKMFFTEKFENGINEKLRKNKKISGKDRNGTSVYQKRLDVDIYDEDSNESRKVNSSRSNYQTFKELYKEKLQQNRHTSYNNMISGGSCGGGTKPNSYSKCNFNY